MNAMPFEPTADPAKTAPDSDGRGIGVADEGLGVVVAAWPELPGDIRKVIVGVVRRTTEAVNVRRRRDDTVSDQGAIPRTAIHALRQLRAA
jgi:hypothetical protein